VRTIANKGHKTFNNRTRLFAQDYTHHFSALNTGLTQVFTCYTVMQKCRLNRRDCGRQRSRLQATSPLSSSKCSAPKNLKPHFLRSGWSDCFQTFTVESTREYCRTAKKRPINVFSKKSGSTAVKFRFWGSDPQTVTPSHMWLRGFVGNVERYSTVKTAHRYHNGYGDMVDRRLSFSPVHRPNRKWAWPNDVTDE